MSELVVDDAKVVHYVATLQDRVRKQPGMATRSCARCVSAFAICAVTEQWFNSGWGLFGSIFVAVAIFEFFSPAILLSGVTRQIQLTENGIRCVRRYGADSVRWHEMVNVEVRLIRNGRLTVNE